MPRLVAIMAQYSARVCATSLAALLLAPSTMRKIESIPFVTRYAFYNVKSFDFFACLNYLNSCGASLCCFSLSTNFLMNTINLVS